MQIVLGTPQVQNQKIPNLKGLTIREALRRLNFTQLRVKINGKGRVVKQSIKPGEIIKSRGQLLLTCTNY